MAQATRTSIYDLSVNPELAELFRIAIRKALLDVRTHVPATVVAYNPATQTVDVQIGHLQVVRDNRTEPTRQNPAPTITQPPLILQGLKVHFPGNPQSYSTRPVLPGDTGEIHVSDRNMSKWLEAGVSQDPVGMWTHALKDGVFYPSSLPNTQLLPPTRLDAHVIEGLIIALGYAATSPLVKGDQLVAAFTAYTTAIATAYATWQGIVPPTSISNAAFLSAIGVATANLALSIPTWLSTKSFTE